MIVSCSTAQAIVGFTNHSGYAASKHALHGFLDTLEMELGGKVKFLETCLGWIKGTNMRSNAFGPNGKKMGETKRKHSSNSVELDVCVEKIISAIVIEKEKVYIPWKLKLIPFLDLFFGKFLRNKINKAVHSE
jgi:short-subunit dehydrogenase